MSFTEVFTGSSVASSNLTYLSVALSANITMAWASDSPNTPYPLSSINDVTPSGAGFSVTLPAGSNAANGSGGLFRNFGTDDFTVHLSDTTTLVTVAAGTSVFVYLQSNATTAGTWSSLVYGVGSAALSAGSVASPTVVAQANTLNSALPVSTVAADYTIPLAGRGNTYVWTGGVGTLSITASSTLGNNWFCLVRNSGTGALTLSPLSAGTIDGASTVALNPTETCIVTCDGSAFYTIGQGRSATFVYSKLTKSVAGSSNVTLSATEYANTIQEFTGALTGNISVIEPTVVGVYYITNSTSGSYTLTVKTAAGTGIVVAQGTRTVLYCDGTNVVAALTGTGSGTVTSVGTSADFTGGPITTSGTLALTNVITAGSYANGVTVSAVGRVTAVDENQPRLLSVWGF
jgi:hypothetical protein